MARAGEKILQKRAMLERLGGGRAAPSHRRRVGSYTNMKDFGMKLDGWREAAQKAGKWHRRVEDAAEAFVQECQDAEMSGEAECDTQRVQQQHGPMTPMREGKGERGCPARETELWVWPSLQSCVPSRNKLP